MSNVEAGGATVFTNIGQAVKPSKVYTGLVNIAVITENAQKPAHRI